ncbi:MAG: Fe-S cluster assembly protein SufD [Saprospiraceae bacterium]
MLSTLQEKQSDTLGWFQKLFEQSLNGQASSALSEWQRLAMEKLEATPFPTRRDEDWKYTAVTRVLAPSYQNGQAITLTHQAVKAANIVCLDTFTLTFINGVFSREHSQLDGLPEGLSLLPMAAALEDVRFKATIEDQLFNEENETHNAFECLNMAFANQGYFVHVPKNVVIEKPIHFLYISHTTQAPIFTHPQVFVCLERSAELQIIEHYLGQASTENPYFTNVTNRFYVAENAHLKHYRIQDESTTAFHINNTRVRQERASTYTAYLSDLGSRIVRNNLGAILLSESTATNFYGMYFARGDQHIDNQTFIDHAFPHCESSELYKGIVNDKASAVFNGKVLVRPDAQKTNAFQQNSSLVLSPSANVDSKPQLEIYADDVKCSHGATIGQLDESAVFYLRSRGLSDEKARALLQHAFLKEVLVNMPEEKVIHAVENLISEKFLLQP